MRVAIIPIFVGLLEGLFACQTYVEVEVVPQAPALTVYSILQPDSLITVWVSQTQVASHDQAPTAINQAEVVVTPEGQPPQFLSLVDVNWGMYQASFRPQSGVTYHLSVTAQGFPPVTATTQLPRPVVIQALHYNRQFLPNPNECGSCPDSVVDYTMELTLADPPSEENYYELVGWVREPKRRTVYDSISFEPVGIVRDTVVTPLSVWSTDPAVSTAEETILYDEAAQSYRLNIPFNDETFSGEPYTFRFQTVERKILPLIKIALRTYHEEAYRYERAKEAQRSYHNRDLFYEPVQIPSNVQGGYGIFSGFSQDAVVIELDE